MSGSREQIPEEVHVLAGEYVLGVLDASEMRAVRQQAAMLPMLAAAITGWEERLSPMTKAIAPLQPPRALWERLEEAIGPEPLTAPPVTSSPVVAAEVPPPPVAPPTSAPPPFAPPPVAEPPIADHPAAAPPVAASPVEPPPVAAPPVEPPPVAAAPVAPPPFAPPPPVAPPPVAPQPVAPPPVAPPPVAPAAAVPAPPLQPLYEVAKELDPTPRFTVTPKREVEPVRWPDDPLPATIPEPVQPRPEPPPVQARAPEPPAYQPAPVEPPVYQPPPVEPPPPAPEARAPEPPAYQPPPVEPPPARAPAPPVPEPPRARAPEPTTWPGEQPTPVRPPAPPPPEASSAHAPEPVVWPEEPPAPEPAIAAAPDQPAPQEPAPPQAPTLDTLASRDAEAVERLKQRLAAAPVPEPGAQTALRPRSFRAATIEDFRTRDVPPDEAKLGDIARESLLPEPANDSEPRRRAVWPWQAATAASMAFAAGVLLFALVPGLAPEAHKQLLADRYSPRVAAIVPADGRTSGFLAEARSDGTVVLTALAPVQVPSGKALELWILPPGQTVPKSLGVLAANGTKVTLPEIPATGTQLMVSLEPPTGSPSGQPTGPVLFAGQLVQMRL
jgi:anti-sigma-K factor RskA